MYRHTVQLRGSGGAVECGACDVRGRPPADRRDGPDGRRSAAGRSLHLSFGSSATFKLLEVVVVAWGGLWTPGAWFRSYYTK